MIKVVGEKVFNLEGAFHGMRNPQNSWARSDSFFDIEEGEEYDYELENVARAYAEQDPNRPNNDEDEDEEGNILEGIYDEKRYWLAQNGRSAFLAWGEHAGEIALIGPNDLILAQRLIKAGTDHRKFMRQIFVTMDIEAPLYW